MLNPIKFTEENFEKVCRRYLRTKFQLLLGVTKNECEKCGIPFEISVDDLEFPSVCEVFGIELDYMKENKGPADNSPSLDRIIPSKGYVKGNVKIISQKANRMKQNCSYDDAISVARYIKLNTGDKQN